MSIPAQDKYNTWTTTRFSQLNANYGGCTYGPFGYPNWSTYFTPFSDSIHNFYYTSVGDSTHTAGRVVSIINNMSTAYLNKCGGKQLIGEDAANTFKTKMDLLDKFINGGIFDLAYSSLLPGATQTIEYIISNIVDCNTARDVVVSATNWVNGKTALITSTIDDLFDNFDGLVEKANKAMSVIGGALNCGVVMYETIEALLPVGYEVNTDWANTVQAVKDAKAAHTDYMDIFNYAKNQTKTSLNLGVDIATVKNDIQYYVDHFEDL